MRRVIIGLISLAFILSVANPCFAKKKKTGEAKKNVYTDTKFGFQITALRNWKVKTQKEPSLLRVLMTQKNYKVSRIPGASRYTTAIPTILILADTTSLSLAEVESCLFHESKKLKNKDDYMMKLDLISNSEYLGIGDVIIDSIPARMYTLQQKYKKTIEDIKQRASPMGNTVIIEDFLAGHVILFKKGKNIYLVQFSCEREFFAPTNEEFQKIIKSWKFTNAANKAKKLKTESEKNRKKQERARLRESCDLELLSWSWSTAAGGSYVKAEGQVKNISGRRLERVTAVVTFYDSNGNFITSADALIDFDPILPEQKSPFSVHARYNPAMKKATVEFKFLMGGTISTYHKQ